MAETRSGCLGPEIEEGACLQRGTRELFGGDANTFFYCVVVTQLYTFAKTHQSVHLKIDEFYSVKLLKRS